MGNFTININSKPVVPYKLYSNVIQDADNCSGDTSIYQVITSNGNAGDNSVMRMVGMYEKPTPTAELKTLHIKNIIYNDITTCSIRYNGQDLLPSTEYSIPLTGLNPENIINNLTININKEALNYDQSSIIFDVAITDSNDVTYDYVTSNFLKTYSECQTPNAVESSFIELGYYEPCDGNYVTFNIINNLNQDLIFEYTVLNGGNYGFTSGIDYLTNSGTMIDTILSSMSPTENINTSVIYTPSTPATDHYIRFHLCAKPTFEEGNNTCKILLKVIDPTDQSIIEEYTLIDTNAF
jgi:hypothetical protein